MQKHPLMKIVAAALVMVSAGAAQAGSATNVMNNIVTLADACDIVAIGVDFGIKSTPIPAAGYAAQVTANTSTGNALTGNTAHPKAGKDGGAGNDDALSLTTGVSVIDTAISTVLTTVIAASPLPGVYVACTTTPTSITLVSSHTGSTAINLPTTLGASPSTTFSGKMAGVGAGATAANTVDYTLTFTGVPVSTNVGVTGVPNLFIAPYLATGAISGTQTGTQVPGYYWDGAVATVNF